jgi:hypothetical protein
MACQESLNSAGFVKKSMGDSISFRITGYRDLIMDLGGTHVD